MTTEKPENPDRIDVPQIPIGDTSGPEWHDTGRTTRIPLPIQLAPGQIRARQREGRELRKEARSRLSDAARAKAVAATEFRAATTHSEDVSNKCATIDQEVETERAMRDGKVQFVHRYPDVGGLGFEIMVRQDAGYENMRHGDERALKPDEWAKQASVPGTVTEPTDKANDVVRAAIELARTELGADAGPDALLKFVRAKVPHLVVDDETIGAHCLSILIEHAVRRAMTPAQDMTAQEIVFAVCSDIGEPCTPQLAGSVLQAMTTSGHIQTDDGDPAIYRLIPAADAEPADSAPESDADDKEMAEMEATEAFDAAVLLVLRELAPKWVDGGPDASAGKVCKHSGNAEWSGPAVNDALKRLATAGLAHKIPRTRSYQAISIVG